MELAKRRADPKRRRRKGRNLQVLEQTISALLADLVHRELTHPGGWVHLPLSNDRLTRRSRYRAPTMNKQLREAIERLSAPPFGLVQVEPGSRQENRETAIAAGPALRVAVEAKGWQKGDLARLPGEELIVLKRARLDFWDKASPIEYADTPRTHGMRAQLLRINEALSAADLRYDPRAPDAAKVDLGDRRMRRMFNAGCHEFNKGGRLFGGFWQPLKSKYRKHIRIGLEPAVELDYRTMFPRLAYARMGLPLPEGDAYTVAGFLEQRDPMKRIFGAMLFSRVPLKRFPKKTRKSFPKSVSIDDVTSALIDKHSDLRSLFFTGIGLDLMYEESEILVDVLLNLIDQGITPLPIHDAIAVGAKAVPAAKEVLESAFTHKTGQPVEIKVG